VQAYEGASTLYGPSSADYFAERFFQLARSMNGFPIDGELGPGQYRLGRPWRSRTKRGRCAPAARAGRCTVVALAGRESPPARPLPIAPACAARNLLLVVRRSSRKGRDPGRTLALDDPGRIRTSRYGPARRSEPFRHLGKPCVIRGRSSTIAAWRSKRESVGARPMMAVVDRIPGLARALGEHAHAGPVRLAAAGADGAAPVRSEAFSSAELPSLCSAEAVRFCLGEGEPGHR